MRIKETPTNFRVYYRMFLESYKQKLEEALLSKQELEEELSICHENINSWKDIYNKEFGVDLNNYTEFINNRYTTGLFYRVAKGIFINKQGNYELTTDAFTLFDLADKQRKLYELERQIELYKKCSKITINKYTEILRLYYTEVHKHLIINGEGYSFSNGIGWICINRCVFDKKKKILDYAATKKRTAELENKGERIYDKEEADWCLRNGIDYNAADKRVFRVDEYCYQIPLIGCKLPNGNSLKLEISDYRHNSLRGKTNADLMNECDGDLNLICELPIDLKTKLNICDKVNKMLYTKFIRNENQKPLTFGKVNR